MKWKFEKIIESDNIPIEGLDWNGQALFYSQPNKDLIYRMDLDKKIPTIYRKYTGKVSGLAYGPSGEFYGCQQFSRRIIRMSTEGPAWAMTYQYEGMPYHESFHNTPKHIAVDSLNRIWFSDPMHPLLGFGPALPFSNHQSILRLEMQADKSWKLIRSTYDTTNPSGVAVSKDAKKLYVGNRTNLVSEVREYAINKNGSLGKYKTLLSFINTHDDSTIIIDGIWVDSKGRIFVCTGSLNNEFSCIYILLPDGQISESHEVPSGRVTNCIFGGVDMNILFIATQNGELLQVNNKNIH